MTKDELFVILKTKMKEGLNTYPMYHIKTIGLCLDLLVGYKFLDRKQDKLARSFLFRIIRIIKENPFGLDDVHMDSLPVIEAEKFLISITGFKNEL